MNKLTALLTIAVLLTSILTPATTTLALTIPKPETIGTPQLSKTKVYIGPDRTVKITVYDDDPIHMEIIDVDEEKNQINVTIHDEVKKLMTGKEDEIYAFISILKDEKPIPLATVYEDEEPLLKDVALLKLIETGNDTKTFTATLTIVPAENTGVDTINGVSVIKVKPKDVADGIVVKIIYPDLVGGELKWINKTFEIKAEIPSIEADKDEVVPGQNFTIILTAQSLNINGETADYIAVSNKTGDVYWVTSEYKVKVGILNITVVNPEDKVVAKGADLAKCVVDPVLVLTTGTEGEELRLYEETGASTAVFKIPVDGKCIRDTLADKGISLTEGYKINVTYTDLYTDKEVYVEIPVKEITVSLKASMYYEEEENKYRKVKDELEELPITYYAKWRGPKTEPEKAGFEYILNITVYDPAHLAKDIKVEIYNVTNNKVKLNGGEHFTVDLQGTGDVRYAVIRVNFTKKLVDEEVKEFMVFRKKGGEMLAEVELDEIYRYPVTGYVRIIYADEYTLELPIALPKDDRIAVTPTTLDRVADNVTLRFIFGDLPVVPEDLAIKVELKTRDGETHAYYFSPEFVEYLRTKKGWDIKATINTTTGVAEINITGTLYALVGKTIGGITIDRSFIREKVVGATITFAYKDPATRFNAGREYTFEASVKVLAHDAKVKLASDVVGPFQWLNITITDPDIFYEAKSYIGDNLVILFNSTAKSVTAGDLGGAFVFKQDGDSYKIAVKLWGITEYFNPAGDEIIIYYYDDTPAKKSGVYRYQGKVIVKPTEGVIVEPKDGVVVSPGQQLVITVRDPDPKDGVSPERQDIIEVTVWSSSYPKRKNITLFETAKDSNVFNTTILVTDDWSSRDHPGIVYAEPGDYIYIIYHDKYPDEVKVVALMVKEAAPAPALMKWIYINASGVELAKDEQWRIEKDPYTGVERLFVRLPFYNETDVEFSTTYYSILYYRESPAAKYEFVDVGSDIPDLTISAGAESVVLPIAPVSKISENARKYGGVEDGLYKIYATLIIVNKATGDLATKVWTPEFGVWVVWPVTLTIYVDAEGNIVKVVLGST